MVQFHSGAPSSTNIMVQFLPLVHLHIPARRRLENLNHDIQDDKYMQFSCLSFDAYHLEGEQHAETLQESLLLVLHALNEDIDTDHPANFLLHDS